MEVALIVFAVYGLAVLIWCASQMASLRYATIPVEMLNRWTADCQNLIVINLQSKSIPGADVATMNAVLDASLMELPSLLRWIPPETRLVFCCPGRMRKFDGRIEELLFRAKINPVYLLALPALEPVSNVGIPRNGRLARLPHLR
jgi:hypothetical protein